MTSVNISASLSVTIIQDLKEAGAEIVDDREFYSSHRSWSKRKVSEIHMTLLAGDAAVYLLLLSKKVALYTMPKRDHGVVVVHHMGSSIEVGASFRDVLYLSRYWANERAHFERQMNFYRKSRRRKDTHRYI